MTNQSNISGSWKIIISIITCELTGILSGLISQSGLTEWYINLNKPEWNQPSSIFGPVWTSLYLLMGISLGIVWKKSETNPEGNAAMKLFALQLFLNFWWSIIFFRFHSLSAAFAVVLILLTLIIIIIFKFSKLSKTSSWLMVPYAAWVSFASILNYTLLTLN